MTKRITSIFLCFLLVFTIVITDYKKVSAFEWAIPIITFDVALPFLMGLLGVTYATSDSSLVPTEDEFFSYAEEQNISGPDVRAWLDNVFSGTLNQASNVWSCFKTWIQNLVNTSVTISGSSVKSLVHSIYSDASNNYGYSSSYADTQTVVDSYIPTKGYYVVNKTSGKVLNIRFFDDSYIYSFTTNGSSSSISFTSLKDNAIQVLASLNISETYFSYSINNTGNAYTQSYSSNAYIYVFGVDDVPAYTNFFKSDLVIEGTTSNNFTSLVDDVTNLDLLGDDAISTSIPDVVSLPWQNVGDTTQDVSQTIEGLIDAVNEGTLELSDLVTTIQGLLGLITVDTTQDIVIPEVINPDTEEPVTPEEVISENINNSAFILSGLEKVFPFCLPFDLYNFVTLLVADPVAPVINFPIYDPTTKESVDIVIDFSEWESIVILFRYIFDFLFIIGMILVSRSLIGGGDKS